MTLYYYLLRYNPTYLDHKQFLTHMVQSIYPYFEDVAFHSITIKQFFDQYYLIKIELLRNRIIQIASTSDTNKKNHPLFAYEDRTK
jgi:hypothetical protein